MLVFNMADQIDCNISVSSTDTTFTNPKVNLLVKRKSKALCDKNLPGGGYFHTQWNPPYNSYLHTPRALTMNARIRLQGPNTLSQI